jgi:hypothetical protein
MRKKQQTPIADFNSGPSGSVAHLVAGRQGNSVPRNHSPQSGRDNIESEGLSGKRSILSLECPYCDGHNELYVSSSDSVVLVLETREIACRYCQCLFLLSECKRIVTQWCAA